MKKIVAMIALGLASVGAQADGVYTLVEVKSWNPFVPAGSVISDTTPGPEPVTAGGTCTVTGSSVSCSGVQFSLINANATFNYTNGSWTTTLGGTSVTHTETCVESAGTPCSGASSGLSGLWNSTQKNGGDPTNGACVASAFFSAGNCDQVSVSETAGTSLVIREQSEFAIAGQPSGYQYTFAAVPIPAAVWLFGSALGLIGLRRRLS